MHKFKKKFKLIVAIAVIIFITGLVIKDTFNTYIETPELEDYSVFLEHLDNNDVDAVYYSIGDEFRYVCFNSETKDMTIQERSKYDYKPDEYHRTYYPTGDETFKSNLVEHGIRVEKNNFEPVSWNIIKALIGALFYVVVVALLIILIGKCSPDVLDVELNAKNHVRFKDVIGLDEVIDDIKFYSRLLSGNIKDKTISVPKGLLLTGPPGTGKTLIAKALAGESGCAFFSINSSEIIDMFIGKGAKNIRTAFKTARKNAPAILFIDEIDAIGGKRGLNISQSTEDRQTLNALLQEMDGFTSNSGVFVIAATNDPDSLDSALKRAGRFDREIKIMPPIDDNVIKQLYDHYLKGKKLAYSIDTASVVKQSRGLTGADIQAICNEAALINLARKGNGITEDMLLEALEKFIIKGNTSKRVVSSEENELIRYHESGHAVMHYLTGIDFQKITVIPTTSGAGGYVLSDLPSRLTEITKKKCESIMCISYAGRASESIKFGQDNVTLGAVQDISDVTDKIRDYVGKFGFTDNKSYLDLSKFRDSDEMLLAMSKGVSARIYAQTEDLLKDNYYLVEALAEALIDTPTLDGKKAIAILDAAKEKHEAENSDTSNLNDNYFANKQRYNKLRSSKNNKHNDY